MKNRLKSFALIGVAFFMLLFFLVNGCSMNVSNSKAGGGVKGHVYTSTRSPLPIEGVTVTMGNQTTTTDEDGYFSFAGFEVGTYTMTAEKEGYSTVTDEIKVVEDKMTTVTIVMPLDPIALLPFSSLATNLDEDVEIEASKTLNKKIDVFTGHGHRLNKGSKSKRVSSMNIYFRHFIAGTTTLESLDENGDPLTYCQAVYPSLSWDGRYMVFSYFNENNTTSKADMEDGVYVRDRQTNELTLISKSGQNPDEYWAIAYPYTSISADGQFAVFYEEIEPSPSPSATDTPEYNYITLHDMDAGSGSRIVSDYNGGTDYPVISADGLYVGICSTKALVDEDTNDDSDIFVYNRETGKFTLVSVNDDGEQTNGDVSWPSLSGDGRYVVFMSDATNLVETTVGKNGQPYQIYLHNTQTHKTTLISKNSDGEQGDNNCYYPHISADGSAITFTSEATNLVDGDDNGRWDVFVYNISTGKLSIASVNSDGELGNGGSGYSYLTTDGKNVMFMSEATNLVDDEISNNLDVYLHNMETGETSLVSKSTSNKPGNGPSFTI